MIINHVLFTIRHLLRHKTNTIITVSGLAAAYAAGLLVFIFVKHEVTFDSFHAGIDRLFYMEGTVDCGKFALGNPPPASLGPRMTAEFPEVTDAVRVQPEECFITVESGPLRLTGLSTEPSFFRVFSFPLIRGGSVNALGDRSDLILSSEAAKRLFGDRDPVGETVSLVIDDRQLRCTISGITAPVPENSSIRFDFLIPLAALYPESLSGTDLTLPTFLKLRSPDAKEALAAKFPGTIDPELSELYRHLNGRGSYSLHPLRKFHLRNDAMYRALANKGNIIYSYLLAGLGALIMCIACVNYATISLSALNGRLKEVGIRKVLGASRREIIIQFVFETVFVSLIALGTGLVLASAALPRFSLLTGSALSFDLSGTLRTIWLLPPVVLGVALIAGLYPALVAARVSSIDLVRKSAPVAGRAIFGRLLILLQFTIAIFLIIGTIFLFRQHQFLLRKDLGFEKSRTIRIDIGDVTDDTERNRSFYEAYKSRLQSSSEIELVAGAEYPLTDSWMTLYDPERRNNRPFRLHINAVDYSYIEILGLTVVAGVPFSAASAATLPHGVIVNEAFVKELDISHPVGTMLRDYLEDERFADAVVQGVVRDFHYQSLAEKIGPACIMYNRGNPYAYVYVTCTGPVSPVLDILEREFRRLQPFVPFQYTFLEEQVARQYEREAHWGTMVTWASIFAIIIACAGLFSLTMHTVSARIKEIGIRKVLGASIFTITAMINKRFLGIVLFANVLAWPAVYYFLGRYLQNYSYHITLDVWTFMAGGLLTLLIAAGTVSILAIQAARRNPVDVLSYE
ncbi:ABC transporter permease [bacterium]|nr:ABC transporter permease [bacterium]